MCLVKKSVTRGEMYASVTSTGKSSNAITRKVHHHHYSPLPSNRVMHTQRPYWCYHGVSRLKVNTAKQRISKFTDNCKVSIVLRVVMQGSIPLRRLGADWRCGPLEVWRKKQVWWKMDGRKVQKTTCSSMPTLELVTRNPLHKECEY
jgi:hypothetical protein